MTRWIRRHLVLSGLFPLATLAIVSGFIVPPVPGDTFEHSSWIWLIADFGLLISASSRELLVRSRADRLSARFPAACARGLTSLATLLAGRKRPALRDEWRSHLAGESGHDPVTWPKVRLALGFVVSAFQYRLADAADMAWWPVDTVRGSRFLSNLFVCGPVIAVLVAIVHHDGRFGLVADDQDPVALGAFLYVVIKTGRWWRGIKLPEPKARRAKE